MAADAGAHGGALWALFSLWCVWGVAPPIDLPGHAAELETLVSLLRGDPEVAKVYEWHPVFGYGLEVWLFLPLAWLTNGAVAAKTAMWLTLTIFPFAHLSLGRAFGRSDETVVLSLPLVFSMSYWWGFLSGLMAQALFLFTLAAFVRAVRTDLAPGSARGASTRTWAVVMVLGLATMQSHLITFAALCVVITLVALSEAPPLKAARAVALAVGPALAIAAPRVLVLASRAVDAGDAPHHLQRRGAPQLVLQALVGRGILGSQAIYLEHVGQWWTARYGGVGHNFFAEYDHHVVRFRPGVSLPNNLLEASAEERATFEEVIVFGEGTLPAPFDGYVVDAQAGRWRRLVRPLVGTARIDADASDHQPIHPFWGCSPSAPSR